VYTKGSRNSYMKNEYVVHELLNGLEFPRLDFYFSDFFYLSRGKTSAAQAAEYFFFPCIIGGQS
jgi:hypothetical protein